MKHLVCMNPNFVENTFIVLKDYEDNFVAENLQVLDGKDKFKLIMRD